ncbi:MAG: sensor domain-containing diguanylate cyclase [Pseudohongiellaceae bacterium]|nr:sensor domain-containing diguanylate cyclase [Pseudohongiellaceae bacterium]
MNSNSTSSEELGDYKVLFHLTPYPMAIVDVTGMIIEYNKAFAELVGFTQITPGTELHPGMISPEFQPNGMRSMDRAKSLIEKALHEGKLSFEWMHKSTTGREFLSHITLEAITFAGKPALFAALQDVSEQRKLERLVDQRTRELNSIVLELEKQTKTDPLTGINNRIKLDEILALEHERFQRSGVPYCIALLDIDHFKQVNDRYGHDIGDQVLKEFSLLLRDNIRSFESVGRWGGEEFLIILPNAQVAQAQLAIEKLLQKIRDTDFEGIDQLRASAGVAQAHRDDSLVTLFKRVDEAMYRAKSLGRDRVELA